MAVVCPRAQQMQHSSSARRAYPRICNSAAHILGLHPQYEVRRIVVELFHSNDQRYAAVGGYESKVHLRRMVKRRRMGAIGLAQSLTFSHSDFAYAKDVRSDFLA